LSKRPKVRVDSSAFSGTIGGFAAAAAVAGDLLSQAITGLS
jgi:hypothetical protein